jgi:glycine oxidase
VQDIIVIGAGVIGLSLARDLSRAGASVTVLERDAAPRGATWAAGGMLAPLGEARQPGPFLSLALESLARWPDWVAALESECGGHADYRACGKLLVGATDAEAARLHARFEWQAADGHDARWIEGPSLRDIESSLAPRWTSGLHLPGHASVDPRRLHALLLRATERAGVKLRCGVAVEGVRRAGGRVTGVVSADGERWAAEWVVVAAGAWSGSLTGLPRPLPVRPVRGQMLALSVDRPVVQGLVAGPGAYLIPREGPNGPLVVVGASMDEAGFTIATDDPTIDGLRRAAEALVPALAGAREQSRWAGLRPATPDDLPILGCDPDTPGLAYATGHHRNGILLAPASAARVASEVLGAGMAPDHEDDFGPDRFAPSP